MISLERKVIIKSQIAQTPKGLIEYMLADLGDPQPGGQFSVFQPYEVVIEPHLTRRTVRSWDHRRLLLG
jgi:hypothetical protein